MSKSLAALLLIAIAQPAAAHCPWLYVTDESHPRLFFGEGLSDRDYHLPAAVTTAEVWQASIDAPDKRLTMTPRQEEGFVGLEAEAAIERRGRLQTSFTYGCYHGTKLLYYAQHFPSGNPSEWPQESPVWPLQVRLSVEEGQLLVAVAWHDEPLAAASLSLLQEAGDGRDRVLAETDELGVARFPLDEVKEGLNGMSVMRVDEGDRGELDGERYTSTTHLLTTTFNYEDQPARSVAALPRLPEAVASFGAAACDGWLYVYGGHIGQAHDHSRDNLSSHFRRTPLDGTVDWEELPMGPPLQGLPLVAHGGKLYRVGGLDARNVSGQEEDLHSVADFASYDPATRGWTALPSLPGERSSHNAVVIGDTLYVVGGWRLSGEDSGEWRSGALAFDLSQADATWRELPEPPFKRRALAVSHVDGRVAALCGMTDGADLSKQVFFFDPASGEWIEGPEFPGEPFDGFGLAAWNLGGVLYAGGMEGVLYCLDEDRRGWTEADEFVTKRFFHQLVPSADGGLLAVGGASPESGHTATIERLEPVLSPPSAHTATSEEE